jgi:hypothetical protein
MKAKIKIKCVETNTVYDSISAMKKALGITRRLYGAKNFLDKDVAVEGKYHFVSVKDDK